LVADHTPAEVPELPNPKPLTRWGVSSGISTPRASPPCAKKCFSPRPPASPLRNPASKFKLAP